MSIYSIVANSSANTALETSSGVHSDHFPSWTALCCHLNKTHLGCGYYPLSYHQQPPVLRITTTFALDKVMQGKFGSSSFITLAAYVGD